MSRPKPGPGKPQPEPTILVGLTGPRWRALAAVLYAALSITEDPVHQTLIKSLYDDIEAQANVKINPVDPS